MYECEWVCVCDELFGTAEGLHTTVRESGNWIELNVKKIRVFSTVILQYSLDESGTVSNGPTDDRRPTTAGTGQNRMWDGDESTQERAGIINYRPVQYIVVLFCTILYRAVIDGQVLNYSGEEEQRRVESCVAEEEEEEHCFTESNYIQNGTKL